MEYKVKNAIMLSRRLNFQCQQRQPVLLMGGAHLRSCVEPSRSQTKRGLATLPPSATTVSWFRMQNKEHRLGHDPTRVCSRRWFFTYGTAPPNQHQHGRVHGVPIVKQSMKYRFRDDMFTYRCLIAVAGFTACYIAAVMLEYVSEIQMPRAFLDAILFRHPYSLVEWACWLVNWPNKLKKGKLEM